MVYLDKAMRSSIYLFFSQIILFAIPTFFFKKKVFHGLSCSEFLSQVLRTIYDITAGKVIAFPQWVSRSMVCFMDKISNAKWVKGWSLRWNLVFLFNFLYCCSHTVISIYPRHCPPPALPSGVCSRVASS